MGGMRGCTLCLCVFPQSYFKVELEKIQKAKDAQQSKDAKDAAKRVAALETSQLQPLFQEAVDGDKLSPPFFNVYFLSIDDPDRRVPHDQPVMFDLDSSLVNCDFNQECLDAASAEGKCHNVKVAMAVDGAGGEMFSDKRVSELLAPFDHARRMLDIASADDDVFATEHRASLAALFP